MVKKSFVKFDKDLPQHNQECLDKFSKEDIKSGKPYFCYFKENNGTNNIISNVWDKKNIDIIEKNFKNALKSWREKCQIS